MPVFIYITHWRRKDWQSIRKEHGPEPDYGIPLNLKMYENGLGFSEVYEVPYNGAVMLGEFV